MTTVFRVGMLMVALVMAACAPRDSAFMNRGGPESLLDVSSEVVNLSIASKKDLDALADWVAGDQPTRADLMCDAQAKNCRDALKILETKGVAVNTSGGAANTVTLVYERILARDCNQRYREPKNKLFNAPAPSFGCSVSANIVQQVSDKKAFINPAISDDPSAASGVMAVQRMNAPKSTPTAAYSIQNSLTKSAKTD
jgi:hypothetical protein